MYLVKTLSTQGEQYSIYGIPKSSLLHCRKLSRKLNSALVPSFHDEIGQLCISYFSFFIYSTTDLVKTLSTQAKQYSGDGIPKSSLLHCIKLSSKLISVLMPSFHDEISQLFVSSLKLFLYSTMDLVKTLSTQANQYSGEVIPKSFPHHCRKLSRKLNSALILSFHDEIGQLCISLLKLFLYSTIDLVKTLSTQAKQYSG